MPSWTPHPPVLPYQLVIAFLLQQSYVFSLLYDLAIPDYRIEVGILDGGDSLWAIEEGSSAFQ